MSLRRPPQHPLPRGLIWKPLGFGIGAFGDPMAEWAYRTPAQPQGLTTAALRRAPQLEQAELADRPWFTLGSSVLGGPDVLAPEHAPALTFLEEEFAGVVSPEVIANVAARLQREAEEWSPVPPDPAPSSADDPAAAARDALERVEADLTVVGPGHNHGPALDPTIEADIREQVQLGRDAIKAGVRGKEGATLVRAGLLTLAGTVGLALAKRLAEHTADDVYPHIKHALAILADHMLQAAAALGHWMAS